MVFSSSHFFNEKYSLKEFYYKFRTTKLSSSREFNIGKRFICIDHKRKFNNIEFNVYFSI